MPFIIFTRPSLHPGRTCRYQDILKDKADPETGSGESGRGETLAVTQTSETRSERTRKRGWSGSVLCPWCLLDSPVVSWCLLVSPGLPWCLLVSSLTTIKCEDSFGEYDDTSAGTDTGHKHEEKMQRNIRGVRKYDLSSYEFSFGPFDTCKIVKLSIQMTQLQLTS